MLELNLPSPWRLERLSTLSNRGGLFTACKTELQANCKGAVTSNTSSSHSKGNHSEKSLGAITSELQAMDANEASNATECHWLAWRAGEWRGAGWAESSRDAFEREVVKISENRLKLHWISMGSNGFEWARMNSKNVHRLANGKNEFRKLDENSYFANTQANSNFYSRASVREQPSTSSNHTIRIHSFRKICFNRFALTGWSEQLANRVPMTERYSEISMPAKIFTANNADHHLEV